MTEYEMMKAQKEEIIRKEEEKREQDFRLRWARYFEARASKSMANAAALPPDKRQHWQDVAAGEAACAMVMKMLDTPLDDLHAALTKSQEPEAVPVAVLPPAESGDGHVMSAYRKSE